MTQFGGERMIPVGGAHIHPTARIYGNVLLGRSSSVWCYAVVRAEAGAVEVGPGSNVQDFVMIHVGLERGTVIGANCSITHHATLHGCIIGDNVLVGIGATIMDGCEIGANSIVAGHAFLKEGTIVPENSIVMGTPGLVVRRRDNSSENRLNAYLYRRNAKAYADGNYRLWQEPQFAAELDRERQRLKQEASAASSVR